MAVSYVPSAEQLVQRRKSTARKRQRNQIDTAISELGDLLPLHTSQSVDKISVLRITSSYMRFRDFMKTVNDENATTSYNGFSEMLPMMIQVSGKLKFLPDPTVEGGGKVTGLVAECRLIESSSSILEVSIFQSSFNITANFNHTILSVDTKVEELIGFTVDDFVGTKFHEYFHPEEQELHNSDVRTIMRKTGCYISPLFRLMTCTGEWVWIQLRALAQYKSGKNKPDYAVFETKVVSGYSGKMQLKELYGASKTVDPAVMNDPHRDAYFLPNKACKESSESIVKALQGTSMCSTTIDALLHSRELGLQELPTHIKKFVPPEHMHMVPPKFVPASHPQSSSSPSPTQTLSPQSSPLVSTLTPSQPSFISHTSSPVPDTATPLSVETSSSSTQLPSSLQPIQDMLVSHILMPSQTPSLPPIQALPVGSNVFTESASFLSLTSSHSVVSHPSAGNAIFEQSGNVSNSEDSFQSSLGFFSPDASPVLPSHGVSADALLVGATSFQQPPLDPNHQIPQTQTNGFLTADFTTLDTSGSLLSSGNEGYDNPDLLMSADPGLFLGNEVLEQLLGEVVSLDGQAISAAVPTEEVPLLTNNGHPPDAFLGNVVQPTALVYGTAQAVDTVAPAMLFKPQDQSAKPSGTNFELPQQNDDLQEFLHELMNPPP